MAHFAAGKGLSAKARNALFMRQGKAKLILKLVINASRPTSQPGRHADLKRYEYGLYYQVESQAQYCVN